ncbi:GroES-like protein [Biscogniauxia sp. FL1348]|nr:GroES-like protein [Biscogniauxia sp. FL1348]
MATHKAAVAHATGQPLKVEERPTPNPGPEELLIDVKSIALNPVDVYSRGHGFALDAYPAVFGSDVGGIVLKAGTGVSSAFKPGTRVSAFAPAYFARGAPDYGAFQERVLVPASNAAPIPDALSFNEAATFPMALATAWAGWKNIGIPPDATFDKQKQGVLVWGASSSVGAMAVQTARLLGFTVYATASPQHHDYVRALGAARVFDYREVGAEEAIVRAARGDRLTFRHGYDAVGALQPCLNVIKALKGDGPAHLASAPMPTRDSDPADNIEIKFVVASADRAERTDEYTFWFNVWLKEKLASGALVPSPKIQVVEGGLAAINTGLDLLRRGISCTKLVLEI